MDIALRAMPQVFGGTSLVTPGGCVVRFLAASAPELCRMTRMLWAITRRLLLCRPPFDERKY